VDAVSRRLELLKLEGLGFSQAEIVNELSQKSCMHQTCGPRILRVALSDSLWFKG
jgi:hypothetical protein